MDCDQKNAGFFTCDKCDFKCSKLSNYNNHLTTAKHQRLTISCQKMPKNADTIDLECICGKKYKHSSSLCKHKKICQHVLQPNTLQLQNNLTIKNNTSHNNSISDSDIVKKDNLIEYLIKENTEFKGLIMELIKKETINNTINNVNSNNKTFNLQFFLNETCKDALNIGEFVDSIQLQLADLETVGQLGYVEGVSKILIKNLNELDTCKRPIHCSDLKREVIYIKDDDKWLKENEDKLVIKKAIKDVANKNIRQIPEWMRKNPNCGNSESNKNDQYLNIVMNSMSGGSNEEQHNNIEKIVKNITKSVIIEK
jgi:hypothetical protein